MADETNAAAPEQEVAAAEQEAGAEEEEPLFPISKAEKEME